MYQDSGKRNSVNIASLTASEIRDIILGQEIAAPSVQRQQMAELEKSPEAHKRKRPTFTVMQFKPSLRPTMSSRWRVRAISATHLPLRLQHICFQ